MEVLISYVSMGVGIIEYSTNVLENGETGETGTDHVLARGRGVCSQDGDARGRGWRQVGTAA